MIMIVRITAYIWPGGDGGDDDAGKDDHGGDDEAHDDDEDDEDDDDDMMLTPMRTTRIGIAILNALWPICTKQLVRKQS